VRIFDDLLSIAAILCGFCLGTIAAEPLGSSVSWLAEVQRVPRDVPAPNRPLAPLLVSASGEQITTLEAWQKQRDHLRQQWRAFLGQMPEPPKVLNLKVLNAEKIDGGTRELIEYEGEPGWRVQGYLLRPAGEAKSRSRPAIVALHPTTNLSIDNIAGVAGPPEKFTGLGLMKAGFVVFCPRCFLWQDAKTIQDATAAHQKRHPNVRGMAKMLYDAQRAVDVVLSLPEVDPARVGTFGHSLGAKEVLYLLAFDDRVKAGVASEGGIALDSTNWEAPWYLGPEARDPKFPRDHHELVGLIAPRPFLVIAGESGAGAADGKRSWPYLEAALPVYKLYGEPARVGLLNHGKGHPLTEADFQKAIEWLKAAL
jgi:dienelactone hydrolase